MTAAGGSRAETIQSDATLHKPLEIGDVVDAVQGYCPRREP